MILRADQLKRISPGTPIERINTFIPYLNEFLPHYDIDQPIEVCSYLAQVLHESGGLKWLREIWGPTTWQIKYEGRVDLGNIYPGDGKKFMGRGLIQITGRSNYKRMSLEIFGDETLLTNPEILSSAKYGTLSSCIYWRWRNLDAYDDDFSIEDETKKVNGGFNGLIDRYKYFNRAREILC